MTARSTARPAPSSTPPDLVLLTGGPRLVLLLLIAAVTALTTVVPVPAQAMPPRSVEVIDTLDAVDAPALTEELDEVGFRSEVDLRVLVLDVTAQGRSASDDRALNDAVLLYARDSRPDLLSEDGDHWADGTVILALDPGNRFLGTYAGEDVKLTDGGFEAAQEDMRDEAQDGDWEATILAGAEEYADRLDRPAWQHPLALLVIIAVPAALIIVLVSLLVARGQARALVDRARETVTAVRGARAVTDRAARELRERAPDSDLAAAALATHQELEEGLAAIDDLDGRVPARPGPGWGLRAGQRAEARELEGAARRLDELDDVVVEARDLLLQQGDWRALWERELAPFRAGFEALPDALELDAEASDGEREAAEELRRVAGEVEDELPGLTADLEARRITPQEALDRLDALTERLSTEARLCRDLGVARLADDEEETELLRGDADFTEAREYGTLREVRRRGQASDSATSNDVWPISPVLWLSDWRASAPDELAEHRDPGSVSGSTGGYSPGVADGFSGAGSSGRF